MVWQPKARERGPIFEGYDSPTTDAPQSLKFLFSEVPAETSPPLEVIASGIVVGVAPLSDFPGELLVAVEDPTNFVRLAMGTSLPPAKRPFSRIWVKRPASVPSDAAKAYYIDVSWDRNFNYGPLSPRIAQAGADTLAITSATSALGLGLLAASRPNRRLVRVKNTSAADKYWSSTANGSAGRLTGGESTDWFPYTGAIYATDNTVEVHEIY